MQAFLLVFIHSSRRLEDFLCIFFTTSAMKNEKSDSDNGNGTDTSSRLIHGKREREREVITINKTANPVD